MSITISDILVVSDMDGTLLNTNKQLHPATVETVRLFRALGGHFTVATGRTHLSIEMYPQLTQLIEPAITCGGTVIYDFDKKDAASASILSPLGARAALKDVLGAFQGIGAMVYGGDFRLYQVAESDTLQGLIRDEKMTCFFRPVEDLPQEWLKILFAAPPEVLLEVGKFVAQRTYPGIYFVPTSQMYLEVMPKGVSKGSALNTLCDMLGVNMRNTFAIGDYFNDVDMLKRAGHSLAMGNAPQEIREQVSRVLDTNDNVGVAQFLYELIRTYAPQEHVW